MWQDNDGNEDGDEAWSSSSSSSDEEGDMDYMEMEGFDLQNANLLEATQFICKNVDLFVNPVEPIDVVEEEDQLSLDDDSSEEDGFEMTFAIKVSDTVKVASNLPIPIQIGDNEFTIQFENEITGFSSSGDEHMIRIKLFQDNNPAGGDAINLIRWIEISNESSGGNFITDLLINFKSGLLTVTLPEKI